MSHFLFLTLNTLSHSRFSLISFRKNTSPNQDLDNKCCLELVCLQRKIQKRWDVEWGISSQKYKVWHIILFRFWQVFYRNWNKLTWIVSFNRGSSSNKIKVFNDYSVNNQFFWIWYIHFDFWIYWNDYYYWIGWFVKMIT